MTEKFAKNLFITGKPGIGKTTIVNDIYNKIKSQSNILIDGFITLEKRN